MDGTELYRKMMLTVSGSKLVERMTLKYGKKMARKFIAGDTLTEALEETRRLNQLGIMVTLDHLGEGITSLDEAKGYKEQYLKLLEGIDEHKVNANVSLKPTQMGMALEREACYENVRAVAARAKELGNFVRLDMEDSPFTQATIDMTLRLHAEGLNNVGTVLQAYLFRTAEDVKTMMKAGVNLRLVKGAYKEPAAIASQRMSEIMDSYKKIIKRHLDREIYTAIASHDDRIINWVKEYSTRHGISKDIFEFQMLYGLRMNDQAELARQGYRIRCYTPYGTMWYPYYTRRLAEKPSNLMMVLKNMFK
ncbi:L-proline dehydrogenase [Paenibacillus uliginis N3/975]|uniref:proline dehydrogenase n=1 Tax=Paenibacillus uliginis N3/975 TaxID=1313296 RepID=A0A1X7HS54_9BACL|nr:proline dehydrogenase family protein [Paenibacillus uliginis]SMF91897.1 L-proline dehydrogenase [Paenibacillus uliginis N3/975]